MTFLCEITGNFDLKLKQIMRAIQLCFYFEGRKAVVYFFDSQKSEEKCVKWRQETVENSIWDSTEPCFEAMKQ